MSGGAMDHSTLALLAMVGPALAHAFLNWREAWPGAYAAAVAAQDALERVHHCEFRPGQREEALVVRTWRGLVRRGHLVGKERVRVQVRRVAGPQLPR